MHRHVVDPQGIGQELHGLRHQRVERDHRTRRWMLAGQGEELLRQALAAGSRLVISVAGSASRLSLRSSRKSSACNTMLVRGIVQFVRHTRQHGTHGAQLLLLEERLLLAFRLRRGPLAFYGPAELRAHLRRGVQQGGIRCQWLVSIRTPAPPRPTSPPKSARQCRL